MEGRQEGVEPLDRAMICRLLAVKWRQSHGVIARCNSAVLRRLVTQDKDLEVLGGVAAGELGEELDGAARGQVGRSWQHRGASAVGAAETPRWQAEVDANPQLMGPV